MFTTNQHGFFKGQSTTSYIYSSIDRLEERSPVAAMLLDFGKVFNSSSLSLLILKVERMGVCGISQE